MVAAQVSGNASAGCGMVEGIVSTAGKASESRGGQGCAAWAWASTVQAEESIQMDTVSMVYCPASIEENRRLDKRDSAHPAGMGDDILGCADSWCVGMVRGCA